MPFTQFDVIKFLYPTLILSPRYVDVLAAQLKQKLTLCEKMATLADRSKQKKAAAAAEEAALRPLLTRLVDNTKVLQAEVCME